MDLKRIGEQTGTVFNRFVQAVGEKVANTEATQLDADVVISMNRSIQITRACERMLSAITALLVPNPALRAENFIRDMFQAKVDKPNNYEALGSTLCALADQYDPDSNIGKILIATGKAQERIGNDENNFVKRCLTSLSDPIQKFIDIECAKAAVARQDLENSRLDYDASRRHVKQALTAASKQSARENEDLKLRQLEHQATMTKTICDKLDADFQQLAPSFKNFAAAQVDFYEASRVNAADLQNRLNEL